MSKRLENKHVNCLICQKKIKCFENKHITHFLNMVMPELNASVEKKTFMVIDCPCFSIYDEKKQLVGMSKSFIKEQGES